MFRNISILFRRFHELIVFIKDFVDGIFGNTENDRYELIYLPISIVVKHFVKQCPYKHSTCFNLNEIRLYISII